MNHSAHNPCQKLRFARIEPIPQCEQTQRLGQWNLAPRLGRPPQPAVAGNNHTATMATSGACQLRDDLKRAAAKRFLHLVGRFAFQATPHREPVNSTMAIGAQGLQIGRLVQAAKFPGYDVVDREGEGQVETARSTAKPIPLRH